MIRQRAKQSRIVKTWSRPKHCKKSSDLRYRLKAVSDVDEVTLDGRLFHFHDNSWHAPGLFAARVPVGGGWSGAPAPE